MAGVPGKENKIIIVKRRKAAAHAHHGGSWKVAYADFVTAMMAFFMVMWLLSMDQKMKDAIEGYFSNPVGFKKGFSSGTTIISNGNSPAGEQKPPLRILIRNSEEKKFTDVAADLRRKINGNEELRLLGAHIEAVKTKSGLRIELIESGNGQTFFRNGSAAMLPVTDTALRLIGEELKELQTPIIIEGHTDAQQFGHDAAYTNWELSADRANAARRVLQICWSRREPYRRSPRDGRPGSACADESARSRQPQDLDPPAVHRSARRDGSRRHADAECRRGEELELALAAPRAVSAALSGLSYRVEAPPQIPRRDGPVRRPLGANLQHALRRRKLAHPIRLLNPFLNSQIEIREDVGATEPEHQEHLRRPPTNALHRCQRVDDLVVRELVKPVDRHVAGVSLRGEVLEIRGFLTRESDAAQLIVG